MSGVIAVHLKPGMRLWSQTSAAAVIVVKAPADDSAELWCGGQQMVTEAPAKPAAEATAATGERVELGKRYADEAGRLELVCTAAGAGPLTLDGVVLGIKAARSLPASD
jgi:hypothetical protein